MYFTSSEIAHSALHAVLFAIIFFLVNLLINSTLKAIDCLRISVTEPLKIRRIIKCGALKKHTLKFTEALAKFIGVITFFVIYILLSYFSLDGEIRLYLLILYFAAFYLLNSAFYGKAIELLDKILPICFYPISLLFSVLFTLPKASRKLLQKKFNKCKKR